MRKKKKNHIKTKKVKKCLKCIRLVGASDGRIDASVKQIKARQGWEASKSPSKVDKTLGSRCSSDWRAKKQIHLFNIWPDNGIEGGGAIIYTADKSLNAHRGRCLAKKKSNNNNNDNERSADDPSRVLTALSGGVTFNLYHSGGETAAQRLSSNLPESSPDLYSEAGRQIPASTDR